MPHEYYWENTIFKKDASRLCHYSDNKTIFVTYIYVYNTIIYEKMYVFTY